MEVPQCNRDFSPTEEQSGVLPIRSLFSIANQRDRCSMALFSEAKGNSGPRSRLKMNTLTKALFILVLSLSCAQFNVAQTQAPQAKLLITNALLLTMVPGQEKPFTGYIVVGNDETITAIGPGSPPSA